MSDYEHWTGTLKELDIPIEFDSWEKQVKYLQGQGYKFEDLDFEDEYFYEQESDCICIKNKWYKVTKKERNTDDDIIEAKKDGDIIRFELRYYNGGCCFSEAMESAMEKLEVNKNGK